MFEDVVMPNGMNSEVLEHLMNPKNYGKLDDANGVGVALDEKTKEYVIFYTLFDNNTIKNASYATNGCQDTVVIGSMFSDMIIGNNLDYANGAIAKMHEKLGELSPQQKICAEIVFSSYLASIKNYDNLQKGLNEELHMFKMKESCDSVGIETQSEEKDDK
jgi:nitrogen fixation NifU-like protein